ncbi:MAG: lipopolysaccharide kinase InaA family protein [Pirellulales bacterium]
MSGPRSLPAPPVASTAAATAEAVADSEVAVAQPPIRWHIAPEWGPRLAALRDVSIQRWLERHSSRIVKHGPHRTVYRIELGDEAVFLKHARCPCRTQRLANLFRNSASRREWHNSRRILERGVPTAEPVAFGERTQGGLIGDSYLLTRSIPRSRSFDEFLAHVDATTSGSERQLARLNAMQRLAELCALAHRAGVEHDDFHVGNVLVQPSADDAALPARLYLIDLPGVRLRRTLNWRRSCDSLATLITGLLFHCDDEQLDALCRHYLAARSDLAIVDLDGATLQILRRSRQLARRVLQRRDQRAFRTNRHFVNDVCDGTRLHLTADLEPRQVYGVVGDGDAPLGKFIDRPCKLTHASVVVEGQLCVADEPWHVAYKRCRVTRLWKLLLAPLRRSRALDAWYRANALVARGIATPRPIMAIEPPWPTRWRESYLATQWIPDVLNLHLYAWKLAELPRDRRVAAANVCAQRMGTLIGRMHHWGVSHRDLKACNLLVASVGNDVECHVVDPDGVRIRRHVSFRRRSRDLARLAASMAAHPWLPKTTLLRFMREYLRAQRDVQLDWKQLWRSIARLSSRAVAHKQRRGEIVA